MRDSPETPCPAESAHESDDAHWMRRALDEARAAAARGEVPVGAVVVRNSQLIAATGGLYI